MASANKGPMDRDLHRRGSVSRETLPAVPVSRETMERLDLYLGLVRQWNRAINLVGRADLAILRTRHLADSLRLVPHVPPDLERGIDLGSGAGFPGLVLAIATGRQFDLIESDQRKAAFLTEAAMRLGAPVHVIASRIEDVDVPPASLVTARALAQLRKLLGLAAPLLAPGGACVFLKGRDVAAELSAASEEWSFHHKTIRDAAWADGVVLRVQSIRPVTPAMTRASRPRPG